MEDQLELAASNTLSEIHRLRAQMFMERAKRLEAQATALALSQQQLQREQMAYAAERSSFSMELRAMYALNDHDSFDVTTGMITRAPGEVKPSVVPVLDRK